MGDKILTDISGNAGYSARVRELQEEISFTIAEYTSSQQRLLVLTVHRLRMAERSWRAYKAEVIWDFRRQALMDAVFYLQQAKDYMTARFTLGVQIAALRQELLLLGE